MRRVADGGGADLMFWFWLERGRRRDEALSENETDAVSSFFGPWKESVTRCGGVVTSSGGDTTPGRAREETT
jgi:hypothetical protein